VNETLAAAAQHCGVALGLGSARILLESPEAPGFAVRRLAPSVPLLANLGAVQLNRGVGLEQCRRLVELVEADALVLHLNPLQEALQAEGDTCFKGLVTRIERVARGLDVPVVVKEVGWGIDAGLARILVDAGVSAIDVAGAGGTSWSEVERHRLEGRRARVAGAFAGWGIPTTDALLAARRAAPDTVLIASGGVRQGMDVAVAIALGADLVGAAGPVLRAATEGVEAVADLVEEWREVLRITMFCVGAADLARLRATPRPTRDGAVVARPTRRHRRQTSSALEAIVTRSPRVVGRA
jgi:isopentenyl-diphosphate delta-isomerase